MKGAGGEGQQQGRKPTLVLSLSGLLLFRLAARQLCGLLNQEPPRSSWATRPQRSGYGRERGKPLSEAIRGEQPAPQREGVAVGEVGIPALGRGEGPLRADAALGHSPGAAAQATADAEQAGIAQADATADHMKPHKAGASGRAVEVGLVGMEPQAQGGEVSKEQLPGTAQGLRVIGEEDQIIHVAKTGPDAWKGP